MSKFILNFSQAISGKVIYLEMLHDFHLVKLFFKRFRVMWFCPDCLSWILIKKKIEEAMKFRMISLLWIIIVITCIMVYEYYKEQNGRKSWIPIGFFTRWSMSWDFLCQFCQYSSDSTKFFLWNKYQYIAY